MLVSLLVFREGEDTWAVYYSCPQSFIVFLFWGLLLNFHWLGHFLGVNTFQQLMSFIEGVICVSLLGMYINLSAVVLSLWITG